VDRSLDQFVIPHFRRWIDLGLDLFFPPHCVGCGEAGADWCATCQQALNVLRGRLCPVCGLPITRTDPCPACANLASTLQVRSFAFYEGPLVRAILHLKYRPNRRLADQMGAWLAEIYYREGWNVDLLVGVPLSKNRFHQRGFNQVNLIVRALSERIRVPFSTHALLRSRETKIQAGLNSVERELNVKDAFLADPDIVAQNAVCIIDDLYTTGATIQACAEAILQAGAAQVYGLTVGRAWQAHYGPYRKPL
jgi:competence protein ComFC